MLQVKDLYNMAKTAGEVEVRPDEQAEQKPLRKAIDAAKNVGGAVAGGAMTAVNALKGFDTAAPLNKLP